MGLYCVWKRKYEIQSKNRAKLQENTAAMFPKQAMLHVDFSFYLSLFTCFYYFFTHRLGI